MKEKVSQFFALLFLIAAGYHLVGIFTPVNQSPVWRHALFVTINLFCGYGILKRPKWFVVFFFVLMLQQLNVHGSSLVNVWVETHRISWIDLAVVITTPIIFLLLFTDMLNKK